MKNKNEHTTMTYEDLQREIAELRKGENALKAAIAKAEDEKNKSNAIIDAIGDGIIIQDTDYKILYQNKIQNDLYGNRVGEYCYKTYEGRDTICEDCPIERSFKDGKIHKAERCVPTENGILYAELTGSSLKDSTGKIIAGIKIVRDVTELKRVEDTLKHRIEMEKLISGISTRFINLSQEEIDTGINSALATIGDFADVDRSYVFMFSENGMSIDNTHDWCAAGIEPQIRNLKGISLNDIPWFAEKLKKHEIFHVPRVIALPPEARAEKKHFQMQGIKSLIVVPMVQGKSLIGFLGFDSVRKEKTWLEEDIGLLKIVSNIFVNALERKRAEEVLHEGEHFLANILASIQDGIGIIDKDMNILHVNPTAKKWYPQTAQFIGRKCYRAYHNRSERCVVCPAWKTLKTGESAYDVVPKHGPGGMEIGWLEIYSYPMIDTTTGEMKGVIEYVRDITERKRIEESLKLFSEAVEGAPDGVQIVDLEGHIFYSNRAVEGMFGFTHEELKGKHVNEMNVDPEFAGKEIIPGIIETGQWVGELMVKRKDGLEFPIWLNASMVKDNNGKPIAMVGIIRDITERKKVEEAIKRYAQELEESNHMKELFIDIMHHDLLNPLSVASGYIQLLQEDQISFKKKTYLEAVERNLVRAHELIENATMFSKLKSMQSIEFETIDLKEVIEGVIENLAPLASRSGMIIEKNITISMPASGNKMIEEVFANLISNAVKYAPQGKRIIVDGMDAGEFWRINVTDFGEGISDADKTRIFYRFLRADKRGVKGSGLGLAIAGRIVELHRGRIWVEDNPEGGAVFVMEIPKQLKQTH